MKDLSLRNTTGQIPEHIGVMTVFCDQNGKPIRRRIMRLASFLGLPWPHADSGAA